MKKWMALMAMVATLAMAGNVYAHGEKPKHGGIVQSANDLSFELVTTDGNATIYVEDHGKKVLMAGATGKLTVLSGAEKAEIPLAPAGENTMVSKGQIKLAKGSKAMASLTFADKKSVNVRFAIK